MNNNNKDKIALKIAILMIVIMSSYFYIKIMGSNNFTEMEIGSSESLKKQIISIVIIVFVILTIVLSFCTFKIIDKKREKAERIKETGKKMKLEYVDVMICNLKRINLSTNPLVFYWIFKDENNDYFLLNQYSYVKNIFVKGQYLIPNYTGVLVRDNNSNLISPGTKMDVYLSQTYNDNRCIFRQGSTPEDNTLEINQVVYYENNLIERPIGTYKCRFNHNNVNFELLKNAKYYEGVIEYNKID